MSSTSPMLRAGLIAAAMLAAPPAVAADYFAGKSIDLVIGAPPGGGYDIYARALARHFGRHVPGQPTIVSKNMPGAGSARAAGFISAVAPKDGTGGWDWASFKSQRPDWLRDGKVNVLLQVGLEPNPELTRMGVPSVFKYLKSEDDRKVVELVISQQVFQRSYIAPPGLPAEPLATLRAAFDATMSDSQFLEDADKLRIDISPLPGGKVQELVQKLYATPKDIVLRARQAISP